MTAESQKQADRELDDLLARCDAYLARESMIDTAIDVALDYIAWTFAISLVLGFVGLAIKAIL